MASKTSSPKTQPRRAIGLTILVATTLILIFGVAQVALAASSDSASAQPASPFALQGTTTPTPTLQIGPLLPYTFTMTSLGYGERTLDGPFDNIEYLLRLPPNWEIQTDGLLELELSYSYDQLEVNNYPTRFGDLTVKLDGQTLRTFPITQRTLTHYLLRIPLPSDLLASGESQHIISLEFDAGLLCDLPHKATLVVHPSSAIFLNYNRHPLELDLSAYPEPFYYSDYMSHIVRLVLPSQPSISDLADALSIAAKLGDVTNTQMVISATTDVDLRQTLSSAATFDDHAIVIGSPQNNTLLPLLNNIAALSVTLHQRQFELATQGPTAIAPGEVFTYTFTVTNTSARSAELSLSNPLPPHTEFVDCGDACQQERGQNTIIWVDLELAPDEALNLSLTLQATEGLTGVVENTATLFETSIGPANGDTIRSEVVVGATADELQLSTAGPSDYFFVYNNQAVAEDDGIIEEVLSPWNNERAILIVTGLSDEAVRKASEAMSSQTRFPGMRGTVALVQEALSPAEIVEPILSPQIETTLADLGYDDRTLYGQSSQRVDFDFNIPIGWQLSDDAAIDLYFTHSQLIDYQNSGLTVLLNRQPAASIALDDETAQVGHLHVPLKNARILGGQNRLSVQVEMSLPGECSNPNSGQAWFVIKNSSNISLGHDEDTGSVFDLDYFPYPFQNNRALSDLLFALPQAPSSDELDIALHLAATLGDSADGKTIVPAVTMGQDLSAEDLAGYHIIAIGRPSRDSLIQQTNAQLPQPFLPNSDEIEQRLDDVVFRLPTGLSLGYTQLIPSPWNEERAFLAITGTKDEGVAEAADTLINRPWTLVGNLAVMKDGTVNTIDTRDLTETGVAIAVVTAVPELAAIPALPTATPQPAQPSTLASAQATPELTTANPSPARTTRPIWLVPLVSVNGLLVAAMVVFAVRQTRRRK